MDYDRHVQRFHPGHALSREAIEALEALIDRWGLDSAVEFGPGLSSLVMLERGMRYMFIDEQGNHNEAWFMYMQELGYTPHGVVVPAQSDGAYDVTLDPDYYDLVVIDGPWQKEGRSVPQALLNYRSVISPETCVVIDDANTEEELVNTIRAWLPLHNRYDVQDQQYSKRTTAFLEVPHESS